MMASSKQRPFTFNCLLKIYRKLVLRFYSPSVYIKHNTYILTSTLGFVISIICSESVRFLLTIDCLFMKVKTLGVRAFISIITRIRRINSL